jgi:hypothetical protein
MKKINSGTNHLFFAYGSNMNAGQISSRCYKPEACAVARLAGHEISFYGHSRRWDGGEATVIPKPGEDVWGVVFKLSLYDSERLDSWQDVRLDGTGAYFHYPTVVMDAEGNEYPVLIYKRFLSGEPGSPSAEYMDAVISGALSHGLPSAYIERLRSIATVEASFPVPRIFEHERLVTFGNNSCDCGGLKKSGSDQP